MSQSQFQVRFKWMPDSIAMWEPLVRIHML